MKGEQKFGESWARARKKTDLLIGIDGVLAWVREHGVGVSRVNNIVRLRELRTRLQMEMNANPYRFVRMDEPYQGDDGQWYAVVYKTLGREDWWELVGPYPHGPAAREAAYAEVSAFARGGR